MPFYYLLAIFIVIIMSMGVLIISRLHKKPKPGFVLVINNMKERTVSRIGHAVIPNFHTYCEVDIRPRLLTINGEKCIIEVKDSDEDIIKFADAFVDRADSEIAAFLTELWDLAGDRASHLADYGLRQRNDNQAT